MSLRILLAALAGFITMFITNGIMAAVVIGAIFLGTHTVISGYTTIDTTGFILSGLFDSIGPAVGMVTIGYIHHRT